MMQSLKVLIADDSSDDTELIVHHLRQSGYAPDWTRVDTEPDYLTHLNPSLDLILADHNMPHFDSAHALALLQEQGLDIPFIIVSGTIGEEAAVSALKRGATDYLLKDRLARLGEAVRHALEQRQLRDEKRQAEAALNRYAKRLELLHQIDRGIIEARSLPALINSVLKHFLQLIPCQRITVGVIDAEIEEGLVSTLSFNSETETGQGVRIPISADFFAGYDERHMRIIHDIRLMPESSVRAEQLASEGIVSALNALLMDQERPLGTLELLADTPGFFTAEYQEVAAEIANQLAIAIRQMKLRQEIERHTALLEQRIEERTTELQAAKDRAEAILDSSVDGILLVSLDQYIQQTNAAFNRLFACEADAYFRHPLTALVHSDDAASVTHAVQANALQGGEQTLEIHARRKDGTVFDAELSIGGIKGSGFVCTVRDITEHKQAEATLRESEMRFRSFFEQPLIGMMITSSDESVMMVNDKLCDLLGYSREELHQLKWTDITHPDDLVAEMEQYNRVLAKEQDGYSMDKRYIRKDGQIIDIILICRGLRDAQGELNRFIALAQDITERKMHERQLRYYASLQESVTDAVISTDLDFRIQSWNPAAERIYGWRAEEVIGRLSQDVLNTESLTGLPRDRSVHDFMELGYWTGEVKQRHRDGRILHILGSTVVFKDEAGHPIGMVAVNHDITERKKVEEDLRESEQKFRLLMEGAPQAIIISDERGSITLVNAQAEKAFGYSREELIGQSVEILVPENLYTQYQQYRAEYGATPHARPIGTMPAVSVRRKDGTRFSAEIGLSFIETKTGLLVMSFIADITEREQNAADLEQQRTFLRQVIDVSPSLIFVKDYDARFVLVNPLVARMYNTTPEALVGKSDADFNPSAEEVDHFLQADRQVIASGVPHFFEEPITSFTGETHWLQTTKVPIISADGKSKYVLGVATDITERKQAENTLREQHEFLQQVINNVPVLIMVKDAAGRFLLVNNREAELYGSTPADMQGKTDADFNPNQAEVSFFLEKDREALETGKTVFIPEETVFSRYYQTSKVPLRNRDGKHDRLLVVASDITERKQAEVALRQAFEKEKELSELKSRFTSMVSHEFRTPLAILMSSTDLLMMHGSRMEEAKKQERFVKIQQQVRRMIDLLDETLAITKAETVGLEFNPQRLNIRDFCLSLVGEFQSASSTHRIEFSSLGEQFDGLFDPKLLHQVITNLLSNAVKYSPLSDSVKFDLVSQDAEVMISVQDYGIGMSEDDLTHLFEPFHRGKNVGSIAGTGLGLPIVRRAVEAQGGSIHAESELNVGTIFIVRLPLSHSV